MAKIIPNQCFETTIDVFNRWNCDSFKEYASMLSKEGDSVCFFEGKRKPISYELALVNTSGKRCSYKIVKTDSSGDKPVTTESYPFLMGYNKPRFKKEVRIELNIFRSFMDPERVNMLREVALSLIKPGEGKVIRDIGGDKLVVQLYSDVQGTRVYRFIYYRAHGQTFSTSNFTIKR